MKLNVKRLESISHSLKAIEDIDKALKWYEDDTKMGPAYMSVSPPGSNQTVHIQVNRKDFKEFMLRNKQNIIDHLKERFEGFEYDPDADWVSDSK